VEIRATNRSKWAILAALDVQLLLTLQLIFRLVSVALVSIVDALSLATCVGFV